MDFVVDVVVKLVSLQENYPARLICNPLRKTRSCGFLTRMSALHDVASYYQLKKESQTGYPQSHII